MALAVSLLPRATLTRCYRILWACFRRQYRQAIASANVEVWHMFEAQQATLPTKRGVYARFIPEEKAEVGSQVTSRSISGFRVATNTQQATAESR